MCCIQSQTPFGGLHFGASLSCMRRDMWLQSPMAERQPDLGAPASPIVASSPPLLRLIVPGGSVAVQAAKVLAELRKVAPQWHIDGPDNIWILKPGGKSRGRGIHCFNSLQKLRLQVRLALLHA